jgi:hypothetical protein
MDRYKQHHPPAYKKSVIITLMDRVKTIWMRLTRPPNYSILSSYSEPMPTPCRTSTKLPGPDLPMRVLRTKATQHTYHIQGTTDHISRLLKKQGIHTIQKLHNKMASSFRSTEDRKFSTQRSGVYKIPCCCGKVHISQIGRHISTSISEHVRDSRLEDQWSAVAEHSAVTKHSIDFDRMEIIANICTYHPSIIRESTEITKHPHNFNREDGYRLNWLHLFPQATHSTISSTEQPLNFPSWPCDKRELS